MVSLMPFQGEFYDCPPTQGYALGYVLMAFQVVSMHGFHYFRNFSKLSIRGLHLHNLLNLWLIIIILNFS